MAQMATIDVPANLSPKDQKKWIAREKRSIKMKARAKEIGENLMGVGIASASAYGYGVVKDKLPNGGMIPGTEIGFDLALGVAGTLGGAVTTGKMSTAAMFAGLGMLLPALREYGEAATFF